MSAINDYRLKNGLRVITLKKPGTLMAVNMGFATGALDDEKEVKGIAHFMEHMLFTGTVKRNHDRLNEDLESLGGDSNAFTDLVSTVVSVSALESELDNALDLISDIVRNSVIDEKELERERAVILSEYREDLEDIESVSYDRLYAAAFPDDELKLSVIGTEKTISNITRDRLLKHYKENMTPSNSVLVIVSPWQEYRVRDAVEKYFSDWTGPDALMRIRKSVESVKGLSRTVKENSEVSTVTCIYSLGEADERSEMALRILNHKLGDSDNSLLFKEVRLKRGLAYDIYSNLDLTDGVGTLEIYCACETGHADEVAEIIKETVEGIKNGTVEIKDRALDIMKKVTKTNVAHLLDDTESLSHYILGNALEHRSLLRYEEDFEMMEKITVQDLRDCAVRYLNDETIHIMTP